MIHQLKITLCLLLVAKLATAQQLSPQTINSVGKTSSNGGILLEDAVGGLLVTTIATSTFIYTQDFLQPDDGTTTVVPPINNVVLSSGSGLDNAATTFIAGNAMLEFTVGEAASITLNSGTSLLTQGILQPYVISGVLPVTGLEFYAKRINNKQVQLDWKTIQEINNKGFYIERKKENETQFAAINFVSSNSVDGNSGFPLQYQKLDDNDFTGITYYRLKQEDLDGKTTYSAIRPVKGDAIKQLILKVWPVPAVSYFTVMVNGLDKPDQLQVVDMSGRLVRTYSIQNQAQQQVNGLPAGTYFIKLASNKIVSEKVLVQ